MQKEICSKHVVVWHWIVFKTPTNLPLRSTQAKPVEGGRSPPYWQLCPLLLSFRNRLSNQCYFISPPVFSIEQAEKKHTTDLISNHYCLLFQVSEKDAKPFPASSSGSCCCIGTTIGNGSSILQLLCFIQMERSGCMRIKRNGRKSSYESFELIIA